MIPPTKVENIPPAFFESHPQFQEKSFNAFQTWVEYVNRLIGATIGLLMLATAALSLGFWKTDRRILLLSLLAMVLTGFEAWLGKLVVDKNLAGGMVTIHLLVATLIMALLILANYLVAARHRLTGAYAKSGTRSLAWLGVAVMALTLVQIVLGTQVRESVDVMAAQLGAARRDSWLTVSVAYSVHKFLWMVMAGALAVWLKRVSVELEGNGMVKKFTIALAVTVALEVIFGIVLSYSDLPPVVQPLHMLFANLIFAAEFSIWIHVVGGKSLGVGSGE